MQPAGFGWFNHAHTEEIPTVDGQNPAPVRLNEATNGTVLE